VKTLLTIFSTLLLFVEVNFAQEYPRPLLLTGQSEISGGLGVTWITENGQTVPYYMIGLMPDLQFGKIGVGLDLTLLVNTKDGTIRKADWSDGAYRKMIRYLSWGQKHDPLYGQVGQLDMAILGHGFIMNDYNNSASFDDRRIGAELDVDFTKYGFEAIYGDFQQPGVMGGRAYVRPLKFTLLGALPIIGGFEVGGTYVTDQNHHSGVTSALYDQTTQQDSVLVNRGRISEFGFDAGLPALRTMFVDVDLYYDYAQIAHFGHGSAAGILGTFRGLGIVNATAKLEHQWDANEFIPEYFDQFYELERYVPNTLSGFISKAEQLDSAKKSQGWYGQIMVAVFGQFQIIGDYRGIDHDPQGGLLHLETQFPKIIPIISFSAGYYRHTNNTLKDAIKLDENSLLYAFLGYKPYPFITVGLNYYWTFIPVDGTYQVQKRIEPQVMFNYSF
jgi:hypothetical protein